MELHDPSKKPAIEAVSCPSYFAEAPYDELLPARLYIHWISYEPLSRLAIECSRPPGLRQTLKTLFAVRWNLIVLRRRFPARYAPAGEAEAGSAGEQPAKESQLETHRDDEAGAVVNCGEAAAPGKDPAAFSSDRFPHASENS